MLAGGKLWHMLGAFFLAFCCACAQAAAAPDPAGRVDLLTGDLQILQAGKPARPGHAGDVIFEGDILATGKDSEAHLSMADTGYIVLRANTRSDLQNEKKVMQEEMRTLYEQEQKRYREELRADRQAGSED
ncbi:MAG TPA: hypothetical protein VF472_04645 [Burkholderiaceae bacterium]